MYMLRNLFTFIGVLCVVGVVALAIQFRGAITAWQSLDSEAQRVYLEMVQKLLATRDAAAATDWKLPVKEGLSPEQVEAALKRVAGEHHFAELGELAPGGPLAEEGKTPHFLKIYLFCRPHFVAKMVSYSIDASAYLPCRITLAEDRMGKLWLISPNLDLMIHGGGPLPPALKNEALEAWEVIRDIMYRGAAGGV